MHKSIPMESWRYQPCPARKESTPVADELASPPMLYSLGALKIC